MRTVAAVAVALRGNAAPGRNWHRALRALQSLGLQRGRRGTSDDGARVRRLHRSVRRDAARRERSLRAARAVARADRIAAAVLHHRDARARRLCVRNAKMVAARRRVSSSRCRRSSESLRNARRCCEYRTASNGRRINRSPRSRCSASAGTFPVMPTGSASSRRLPCGSFSRSRIAGAVLARRLRAAIWALVAAGVIVFVAIGRARAASRLPTRGSSATFRRAASSASFTIWPAFLRRCWSCSRARRRRACARLATSALAAGIALPITWLFRPPSDLWIALECVSASQSLRGPRLRALRLLPAFQPLAVARRRRRRRRSRRVRLSRPGRGAQRILSDVSGRHGARALRADRRRFGAACIGRRPQIVRAAVARFANGGAIGLAASSLAPMPATAAAASGALFARRDAAGLGMRMRRAVVALVDRLGACDVFFGERAGYAPCDRSPRRAIRSIRAARGSTPVLHSPSLPRLRRASAGRLRNRPFRIRSSRTSWLLAYVRGR